MSTLVSACLLGFPCRHDGNDKRDERVIAALEGDEIVPVCPEVAGGLGIPREPAYVEGGSVFGRTTGADVTAPFERGARIAVQAARAFGVSRAILKQNSPSCGTVMTGTREGRTTGQGVAARALAGIGLPVAGEDAL